MVEMISSYFDSPVGRIKISCGENNITEVLFIEQGTNSNATGVDQRNEQHPLLRQCRAELEEYFNGIRKTFQVPFQQDGTIFQQSVWEQLLKIPYGNTISYLQLSQRLGNEKAIRAAAASNGKNKLAVIVPCHRVIGTNRDMVGYAGGIPRKKWLLAHEAQYTYGIQTLFS